MEVEEGQQVFRFRWNDHTEHLSKLLSLQRLEEKYCDITLVSDDGYLTKAHQAILVSCSEYFEDVLAVVSPDQHPMVVLRGANLQELTCILDYMYQGKTQVAQGLMKSLLEVADMLGVKGLSGIRSNPAIEKFISTTTTTTTDKPTTTAPTTTININTVQPLPKSTTTTTTTSVSPTTTITTATTTSTRYHHTQPQSTKKLSSSGAKSSGIDLSFTKSEPVSPEGKIVTAPHVKAAQGVMFEEVEEVVEEDILPHSPPSKRKMAEEDLAGTSDNTITFTATLSATEEIFVDEGFGKLKQEILDDYEEEEEVDRLMEGFEEVEVGKVEVVDEALPPTESPIDPLNPLSLVVMSMRSSKGVARLANRSVHTLVGPPLGPKRKELVKKPRSVIKRPMNKFLLFHQDAVMRYKRCHPNASLRNLQWDVGEQWRNLPDAEKEKWEAKAKALKEQHLKQYPNYKFNGRQHKKELQLYYKKRRERGLANSSSSRSNDDAATASTSTATTAATASDKSHWKPLDIAGWHFAPGK